jgi:hypothetical protein
LVDVPGHQSNTKTVPKLRLLLSISVKYGFSVTFDCAYVYFRFILGFWTHGRWHIVALPFGNSAICQRAGGKLRQNAVAAAVIGAAGVKSSKKSKT